MNTKGNEKYIGLVKWFHDQTRDANYGFIQHAKLGDLFFHERSIEQGQDIKSFRENAIVVFVAQESKNIKENWKPLM
ncbi:MAG: cold shock domain-containing protein [Bacteroidetes bacterium]|nr:cold shock domain-containing protein [Bacteroidota bacterium]